MRKKIVYGLMFLFMAFILPNKIVAITCDYGSGVRVTYENGELGYDYNELMNTWYSNSVFFWDSTVDKYYYDDVLIDQEELMQELEKNFCPSSVYICEQSVWGLEMPSLDILANSLSLTTYDLLKALTNGYVDFSQYLDKNKTYSALQLNKKQLHIMGQTTYENEYSHFVGGRFTDIIDENAEVGADWCTLWDGTAVGQQAVDLVCGITWAAVGTVWDSISSDDKTLFGYTDLHCSYYNYPEDGPYSKLNVECVKLSSNDKLLDNYIKDYKECDEDDNVCKLNSRSLIDKKFLEMRKNCDSILSNFNYKGDQKDCIDTCLNLPDKLNEIKNIDNDGKCGFSGKLIQFIANIIKWVKYIIPVIVIVLGILDFIKAIGADKDDEMKKAQGRFVKRLIAAALIFIIPFIIEFVLDKMGFGANGCGIIDL